MTNFLVFHVNRKEEALKELKEVAKKHGAVCSEAVIAEAISERQLNECAGKKLTKEALWAIYDYWLRKYDLVTCEDLEPLIDATFEYYDDIDKYFEEDAVKNNDE